MDQTVPDIRFDSQGVCHLCHVHDRLARTYSIGQDREKECRFEQLVDEIRRAGKGKPYDCVVPISGGSDSSFALYHAKQLGLRPVAYHFDNGWVSEVGRKNIHRVTDGLGVPLRIHTYPQEGLRDTYLACLRASIPEVCLPCLVGIFSLAYKAAEEEGLRHVIFGSSPLTEGIAPLSWSYVDGRYLEGVVQRYGGPAALKVVRDFNRLSPFRLASNVFKRTEVIMLPLYVEWDESRNRALLAEELGWIDEGKHADCIYNDFRDYVIWRKFGFDLRRQAPAAGVRNGKLSRTEALRQMEEHPLTEDESLTATILDRLGISRAEYEAILALRPKSFHEYSTYYPIVKQMKPVIRVLSKLRLLSEHVYDKYFEC